MQYLRIYESQSAGVVDLHPLHGQDEFNNNFEASKIMADHGHYVQLLPELTEIEVEERRLWLSDVEYRKNPDVRINGIMVGDIKTPNPQIGVRQATISRCIYSCARQKVSVAIINLIDLQYSIQDLKNGIVGSLQPDRNKTIKQVWVITRNRGLFIADREKVFDDSVYEELKLF